MRSIQQFFTPITQNTGRTNYFIDEFGMLVPAIVLLFAIYFWTRRRELPAALERSQRDNQLTVGRTRAVTPQSICNMPLYWPQPQVQTMQHNLVTKQVAAYVHLTRAGYRSTSGSSKLA